jgi:ATP/maltotriose-dependent transcriptional regulator MalT
VLDGGEPGPHRALVDAQRAVFALLDGRNDESLATSRPLVDHQHPWVRFTSLIAHEQALAYADRGDEAADVAAAAFDEFGGQESELLGDPAFHVVGQLLGLTFAGRIAEAQAIGELVYAVAVADPELESRAWAALLVAMTALFRGDLTAAGEHFTEAELLLVEADLGGISRWAAAGVAMTAFGRGRAADGVAALERVDRRKADGFGAFEPLVDLAAAWSLMAAGRHEDAARQGLAAAERAAADGSWVHAAHAAHDLGRFGLWASAQEALALLPGTDGLLTARRRRFVEAGAAGDAVGLVEAGEGFAELGTDLFAAEAFALAARRADGREAAELRSRAASLLTGCPGADTPPLRDVGPADRLSTRELEVARLASTGRTNREIADALVLSERTVENHLYRAFTKLGVGAREDLADALSTALGGG